MDWIGFSFFISFLVIIGIGFYITRPKLSKQEKDFVAFVQDEAKKNNLKKDDVHGFLFENWDSFLLVYSMKNRGLALNNVPLVMRTIENTYL